MSTWRAGESFREGGVVSDVATDSEDRVYACVRLRQGPDGNEGEMWVFDRNGKLLDRWGRDIFEVPHGLFIHEDVLYHADAGDHTVRSFTPDGKTLMVLGTPGTAGPGGRAVPVADEPDDRRVGGPVRVGRI